MDLCHIMDVKPVTAADMGANFGKQEIVYMHLNCIPMGFIAFVMRIYSVEKKPCRATVTFSFL